MNVIHSKNRKRVQAQQNRDYLDFNRINPIGDDQGQRQPDEQNNRNELTFTTFATRGNSVVKQSSTYLSITSGRGYAHGEVGIAYLDIESPAVKLIQLSDDPWYSGLLMKINIIDPCLILLPHTIYDAKPETSDGKLVKFIREQFPKLSLVKVPRRHFSETEGIDFIIKYCSDKYNYIKDEIKTKYYACAAVAGLFKYLQFICYIYFKENSLKLDFQTKFAHMQIDIETSYKLELLAQSNPNTVKSSFPSLYDVLDYCVTSLGKRTLRAQILEPMCDISRITEIHHCIAELNQQEYVELVPCLKNILQNFNNVERLQKLALVVPQDDNIRAAEILINQALHLRKCLEFVPTLRMKLMPLIGKKFKEIQESLMDERYEAMLNHINTVINRNLLEFHKDSSSQLFHRMNCVQNGVNDLIDILRKSYTELTSQIEGLVSETSVRYGHAFKMNYSVQRSFHMILMVPHRTFIQSLPDELEVLEIKRNTCYCTIPEMKKLNIRIQNVIEEITVQSNVVIAVMLNDIVKEIDVIYDLSGYTATLDIILSFATVSGNEGYVCPTFGDEMRIVDAVHPLLEQNIHRTVATPNNIIATPEYNFYIITGPNMSGKTVYIKTIAILQIMAQLGCYLPARSAQFRVTDRIFSRMGFNDSIEKNLSTFMMEMNNMEHILKSVTPNSLVIIDELCRSTNPTEGFQLAWNLSEHLASIRGLVNDGKYFVNENRMPVENESNDGDGNVEMRDEAVSSIERTSIATRSSTWKNSKLKMITAPFIFLTTHFHNLTKLAESFFNVVNLSFSLEQVTHENGLQTLVYNHRIQEGATTSTSYGLAVAKTVRFPQSVFDRATEIRANFETGENNLNQTKYRKCKLSNLGRYIMQHIPNARASLLDDARTVVSAIINIDAPRRRRRFAPSLMDESTTSSEYIDHKRIDRILYNEYGDIASIARNAMVEWDMRYENNSNISVEDVQNDAIHRFLADFIHEQQDDLIEALATLDLHQYITNAPTESASHAPNEHNNPSIIRTTSPNTPPIVGQTDNASENSSIISIQRVPHEMQLPPILERSSSSSSSNTEYSQSSSYRVTTNSNHSDHRTITSPRTPTNNTNFNVSSGGLENSTSFSGSSYSTSEDEDDDSYIPASFDTSPNAHDSIGDADDFVVNSSNFHFDDAISDRIQTPFHQNRTDSRSQSSFQLFERSQSHHDLFSQSNFKENQCSSTYFLQQEDDNEITSPVPFQFTSFSSISSSQRNQPKLSNIRKVTQTSQSLVNLPSGSHSGSSSSKLRKGSPIDSTFRSSDSTRSFGKKDPEKIKRKIPTIQKSKLSVPSVFGNTSKLFGTQFRANEPQKRNFRAIAIGPPPPRSSPDNIRNTDTNFIATMERLQKIRAKIATTNTSTQQNLTNQAGPSNQQASTTQKIDDEIVPPTPESLLPPPGFR